MNPLAPARETAYGAARWDGWSSRGAKYKAGDCPSRWPGFKAMEEGYALKAIRTAKPNPPALTTPPPSPDMVAIPPELLPNLKTYLDLPTPDLEYIVKLAQGQIRAQQEKRIQAWKDEACALFAEMVPWFAVDAGVAELHKQLESV